MEDHPNTLDAAARAIQEKKPIPEIDFSLHTMEDGTQVSTQERVCKGALVVSITPGNTNAESTSQRSRRPLFFHRRKASFYPHTTVPSLICNSSSSIFTAKVV